MGIESFGEQSAVRALICGKIQLWEHRLWWEPRALGTEFDGKNRDFGNIDLWGTKLWEQTVWWEQGCGIYNIYILCVHNINR